MTRWDETSRSVVWRPTNLYANFARVLAQRMMDGERQGCQYLPLGASNFVSLEAVSQFLADDLDDSRIGDLIWGLVTVKQKTGLIVGKRADVSVLPLPRAYALLKLLFLPERLQINDLPIHIRPESEILALLEAGRCGEACRTAARRLRASGLAPLPHARSGGAARDGDWEELDQLNLDGRRLAGALLLPLARASVGQLLRLVVREPKVEAQTL